MLMKINTLALFLEAFRQRLSAIYLHFAAKTPSRDYSLSYAPLAACHGYLAAKMNRSERKRPVGHPMELRPQREAQTEKWLYEVRGIE